MSEDHEIQQLDGVAFVLPRYESIGRARRIGPLAAWASFGWHRWGVGFFVLEAGILFQIGPVYFGFCHIERQGAAYRRLDALRSETPT